MRFFVILNVKNLEKGEQVWPKDKPSGLALVDRIRKEYPQVPLSDIVSEPIQRYRQKGKRIVIEIHDEELIREIGRRSGAFMNHNAVEVDVSFGLLQERYLIWDVKRSDYGTLLVAEILMDKFVLDWFGRIRWRPAKVKPWML